MPDEFERPRGDTDGERGAEGAFVIHMWEIVSDKNSVSPFQPFLQLGQPASPPESVSARHVQGWRTQCRGARDLLSRVGSPRRDRTVRCGSAGERIRVERTLPKETPEPRRRQVDKSSSLRPSQRGHRSPAEPRSSPGEISGTDEHTLPSNLPWLWVAPASQAW